MEVQSVSHRLFYSGQSLRDREVVCPKVNRAVKSSKPKQRGNSVSFLKRTLSADELILNKKVEDNNHLYFGKFKENQLNEDGLYFNKDDGNYFYGIFNRGKFEHGLYSNLNKF